MEDIEEIMMNGRHVGLGHPRKNTKKLSFNVFSRGSP